MSRQALGVGSGIRVHLGAGVGSQAASVSPGAVGLWGEGAAGTAEATHRLDSRPPTFCCACQFCSAAFSRNCSWCSKSSGILVENLIHQYWVTEQEFSDLAEWLHIALEGPQESVPVPSERWHPQPLRPGIHKITWACCSSGPASRISPLNWELQEEMERSMRPSLSNQGLAQVGGRG